MTGGAPEPGWTPLAGAVAAYLDRSGLAEPLARLDALEHWAAAVGPVVAGVSRAVEVRGDALVVEVATSEWATELSMMKPVILERLNAGRGAPPVGDVRFRLRAGEAAALGRRGRRSRRRGTDTHHNVAEDGVGRE